MCGTATHSTAKFIAKMLPPVMTHCCRNNIKDSFSFVNDLKSIDLHDQSINCIGSLDIVSLFTSVPVSKCIDYICEIVSQDNFPFLLNTKDLKFFLEICVLNVQFIFNGKYYRQIDGVAVGSPLGPVLLDTLRHRVWI